MDPHPGTVRAACDTRRCPSRATSTARHAPRRGGPPYEQLRDACRAKIERGTFAPGDRLPPVRVARSSSTSRPTPLPARTASWKPRAGSSAAAAPAPSSPTGSRRATTRSRHSTPPRAYAEARSALGFDAEPPLERSAACANRPGPRTDLRDSSGCSTASPGPYASRTHVRRPDPRAARRSAPRRRAALDRGRRRHRQDHHAGRPGDHVARPRASGPNGSCCSRSAGAPPARCSSEPSATVAIATPDGSGAARSTPSRTGCSVCTAAPSGSRPDSRCSIRPIPPMCSTCSATSSVSQRASAASRARRRSRQIHSRVVNAGEKLDAVLDRHYPWCHDETDGIREIFQAYTARKREQQSLDYDDLLLFWRALASVAVDGPAGRRDVRPRPGRRVPGHERAAGRHPRGDAAGRHRPQPHRRRRRRPGDLRVPCRDRPQHPGVPDALPRRHGREARAQLPLDHADPRRSPTR